MPHEIILEPKGAYKRFWGHLTAREFIASVNAMHGNPHFDELRYTINDFTDVEGLDVSKEDVEYLAIINRGARKTNPNIRFAIVTQDERIRALVDHFTSPELASYPTRVFDSLADARAWTQPSPSAERD